MDILGQDERTPVIRNKWHNSVESDLNEKINELSAELLKQRDIRDTALENYRFCVNERAKKIFGAFNCKANTGDVYTQSQWKSRYDAAKRKVDEIESALPKLKKERDELVAAREAGGRADEAGGDAGAAEAKKYGIWIAVGLIAIAGGFIVYKKFIKK